MASQNPTTWDEYEGGTGSPRRSRSSSSMTNHSVQFSDHDVLDGNADDAIHEGMPQLRQRRSSITNRLTALTDIGGVNSIRSFRRSWQRAAGFAEVIPQRPEFVFGPDQEALAQDDSILEPYKVATGTCSPNKRTPLLRQQHLEQQRSQAASSSASQTEPGLTKQPSDYRERERKALDNELAQVFRLDSRDNDSDQDTGNGSMFSQPPHLATSPLIGTVWSSDGSRGYDDGVAPRRQRSGSQYPDAGGDMVEVVLGAPRDREIEPIRVKEVEQDGKIVLAVEGQSTLPQTVFNSINVLVGVGLLSLPKGVKYAGWLCGLVFLFLSASVTCYTARLLAKCIDLDPSIITFSDLAFISYGRDARIATSVLFTLELLAACVALIVLFADSMSLLFPGLMSLTEWKALCSLLMIPLNLLPLRLLSFTSIMGIFSCLSIVTILIMDGFIKPTSPGSLIDPARTFLLPANWLSLPLSFGLLMSPWGGHSVFPNIYRDMRHPQKYAKVIRVTFGFTYLLDATTAIAGLLMFGDEVRDEITSNILQTTEYPRALTVLMCVFIGIIPLTKIPLNARPIVSTLEVLLGLNLVAGDASRSVSWTRLSKLGVRVATILFFFAISIFIPAFDSIMAFMGSALCFTICVTLPLAFYLKLFGHDITPRERIVATVIMALSTVLSILGTVWAFLPKDLIGAA